MSSRTPSRSDQPPEQQEATSRAGTDPNRLSPGHRGSSQQHAPSAAEEPAELPLIRGLAGQEELLKDEVRTRAFRNVILHNRHLFEGKVVLEIGCGLGLLSLFCARAGARAVFGVDESDAVDVAAEIARANGFRNVSFVKGRVQDLQLPTAYRNVDVIVSDWMGFCLVFDSLIDQVIHARDKWLVPGGRIFPDRATLCLACAEDEVFREEKIDYWDNVFGFDMSSVKACSLVEPLVDKVSGRHVISSSCVVKQIDLMSTTTNELEFSAPFRLRSERNDFCHAFVAYFDVVFSHGHKPMEFSTHPSADETHWRQTMFYLAEPLIMNAGEQVEGVMTVRHRHEQRTQGPDGRPNPEEMDVLFEVHFDGKDCRCHYEQPFRMR